MKQRQIETIAFFIVGPFQSASCAARVVGITDKRLRKRAKVQRGKTRKDDHGARGTKKQPTGYQLPLAPHGAAEEREPGYSPDDAPAKREPEVMTNDEMKMASPSFNQCLMRRLVQR
jgi:hypothetical protein